MISVHCGKKNNAIPYGAGWADVVRSHATNDMLANTGAVFMSQSHNYFSRHEFSIFIYRCVCVPAYFKQVCTIS
jgi:hypothetical protein